MRLGIRPLLLVALASVPTVALAQEAPTRTYAPLNTRDIKQRMSNALYSCLVSYIAPDGDKSATSGARKASLVIELDRRGNVIRTRAAEGDKAVTDHYIGEIKRCGPYPMVLRLEAADDDVFLLPLKISY